MLNKELKKLWKSKEKSLKEIENILLTRKHRFIRATEGNVSMLLTFIDRTTEDDEDLIITVSSIYSIDERPGSIIIK